MAPPRQAPPPTAPPPQSASADTPTGKIAALPATELLPLAALAVAAPGVPYTAAQIAQALAKALKAILGAFDLFERKRAVQTRRRLTATLTTMFPERTAQEIDELVAEEMQRDIEFRKKQRARLERDLPEALKIEEPGARRAAVQKILERERRFAQMREQAMTERAAARTNYLKVEEDSPVGAYWRLSEHVKEHTPLCIAMGGKFWPWVALRKVHPKLHPGCACDLLTADDAVRDGFMAADQVPRDDDMVWRKDAMVRLQEISRKLGGLTEANVTAQEVEAHMDRVMDEPLLVSLREAGSGYSLRYAAGTAKGGEYRPRLGGNPGRMVARRLLRDLVPHRPMSPRERRQSHLGQWRSIGGTRVFVPEHRSWERTLNGRQWYSPTGSTNVYDRGEAGMRRPEIPFERGRVVTDEMVRARQENREAAAAVARRALEQGTPEIRPVEIGAHSKATHGGMLDAGFRLRTNRIDPATGVVTYDYVHPPTGAEASVRYGDTGSGEGGVLGAEWRPGGSPLLAAPLLQGRPPESFEEFTTDVFSQMVEQAKLVGQDVFIARIQSDPNLADHEGFHHWDGVVDLGRDIEPTMALLAQAHADGRELNFTEARGVYASIRTAAHEGLHGINPITQAEFSRPSQKALEEALTDELSHTMTVEMLRRYGRDDVLKWLKSNPTDLKVDGAYSLYRDALGKVFERAGLPPEQYRPVVEALKYSIPPGQRLDALAGLLHGDFTPAGSDEAHSAARTWVDQTMGLAQYRMEHNNDDIIFAPLVRADLKDVGVDAPVQFGEHTVTPGTRFAVRQRDGSTRPGMVLDASPRNLLGDESGKQDSFVARVRYYDDGSVHMVTPGMVTGVVQRPIGQASVRDEIVVNGAPLKPGDVVSYDRRGNADASVERSFARIERITRAQNYDIAVPENGWQIEATALDTSANPGEPVLLTAERAPGLKVEPEGMANPSVAYVDANTIPVPTRLGPVTFSSTGDAIGQEYHSTYVAKLADGSKVGAISVAYHGDTAYVKMIEVPEQYRRQGVASALVQRVRNEDPGVKIETLGDVATPEGQAFVAAGRRSRHTELLTELEAISKTADDRRAAATDQSIRGLRVAGTDWMTQEELRRHSEIQAQLVPYTQADRAGAAGRVAVKRAARVAARETIPNDQRVYIAEGAMERGGLDGGQMISKHGHIDSPEQQAENARLSKEAQEISGDPTLRVQVSSWIAGDDGSQGHALYNRMSHKVVIRPVSTRLTFLHEIAHAMTHTAHNEPDGHGLDFVRNARDLYAKHISQEAADVFWNLAGPQYRKDILEAKLTDAKKCKYCEKEPTKAMIWADGRAFIPVCDDHEQKARDVIDEQNDEVTRVVDLAESKISFEKETELIRERKKLPAASKRHKFDAAEWTHPNGHPRCLVCGDEETIGGICNPSPAELERAMKASATDLGESFDESLHPRGRVGEWVRKHTVHPEGAKPLLDRLHSVKGETGRLTHVRLALAQAKRPGRVVRALLDANGDPVAALSYSRDESKLHVGYVGSVVPGGGTQLMREVLATARADGLGISFRVTPGAEGFFRKLGIDASPNQDVELDSAAVHLLEAFEEELHPRDRRGRWSHALVKLPRKSPFFIRVTHEDPKMIHGIEVNRYGDEIVPPGVDPHSGDRFTERLHVIDKSVAEKIVPHVMHPKYATLDPAKLPGLEGAVKLPKAGKLRVIAEPVVKSIDDLLDLPELPPIKVQAIQGKGKRGRYKRVASEEGGPHTPESILISTIEDEHTPGAQALTVAHEIAHFLDNAGFPDGHEGRTFESLFAVANTYSDEQWAKVGEKFKETYQRRPSPLDDWYLAVHASPTMDRLTQPTSLMNHETIKYLINPKELFARSFAQWVATRSQDPALMRGLREWQNYPKEVPRVYENWKGEKRTQMVAPPEFQFHKQWPDDEFEPIGAALDTAFRQLGWMA